MKKENIVLKSNSHSGDAIKKGKGWDKFISHELFEKYKNDYIQGNKLIVTCEVEKS